jgi:hypothetical protein
MLNRFALVIHWLGLLVGLSLLVVGLLTFDLTTTTLVRDNTCDMYLDSAMSDEDKAAFELQDFSGVSDEGLCLRLLELEDGEIYRDVKKPSFLNWLLILALTIIPLILGWAIRFILSGENVVLPWLKPKETE